jgi:hypothetical protein
MVNLFKRDVTLGAWLDAEYEARREAQHAERVTREADFARWAHGKRVAAADKMLARKLAELGVS